MGAGAVVSSIKIKGKVNAGYTVLAGEYVEATYGPTYYNPSSGNAFAWSGVTVRYAQGDSVASTIATGLAGTSYSLISAVCFQNSP